VLLALRVLWLTLPVTAGPAVANGLDGASGPVQVVVALLVWAAWAVGLVAVLVPRSVSLTTVRVLGPAALAVAVWATIAGDVGPASVVALAATAALAAIALIVPGVTDAFVDGSSYGPERRFALRTPAPLLLGPVEVAWVAAMTGAVTGPLLLATKAWIAGGLAIIVGPAVALFALRSLHQLSRRWIVFVPAGLVLHDPIMLADPALFTKTTITSLGPAPADAAAKATDLTGGALGLALELRVTDSSGVKRRDNSVVSDDRLLVTPGRPGALLTEARQRRLATTMPPPSTSSPS
jgi:hypothetical protein